MRRVFTVVSLCGGLLFAVCGCWVPLRDAAVPQRAADGRDVTRDPRFLCGEANSTRPIRPGATKQVVHATFDDFRSDIPPTPSREVYRFRYRVQYFTFMNIEWGLLGFGWQNRDCSLWVYYDQSEVVRGWKFDPVGPWVGKKPGMKELTYAGSVEW
jgi:hypothetical protein